MTFEDLEKMKRVSDPQISPSGKWVMFSVMDVDLERNEKVNHLWVVPADGSAREKQLTFGEGESSGRFSPDGTRFVYVAKGQLRLAAWDDKRGQMATSVQLTHITTEADAPLWSPDGESLAFVSEVYPQCAAGPVYDEACNRKAEDEAAHAPTKAMIFDSLLYRHWNTYQGVAALAHPDAACEGAGEDLRPDADERLGRECDCASVFAGRSAGVCVGAGLEGVCVCGERGQGAGGKHEQRYLHDRCDAA